MIFSPPWEKLKRKFLTSISIPRAKNRLLARFDTLESSSKTGHHQLLARLDAVENKLRVLESLSHGARATYVGNNRVLVKLVVANKNIAFFVEANDRLLSPWLIVTGTYETQLTDYFTRELRPESHCIDVGANFGYFTCLMACFCPRGRVIGIEPIEHVYEIARDNVSINSFQDIASVIHAGASDSAAKMTLFRRKTRSGNTSIAKPTDDFLRSMGEHESEAFVVRSLRIDDLLSEMNYRVDFVKIDVEGAEPLVFEGARKTIAANPTLTIVTEWSPVQIRAAGFEVPAFLAALDAMGLRSYDLTPQGLVPVSFDNLLNIPYRAGVVLKNIACSSMM